MDDHLLNNWFMHRVGKRKLEMKMERINLGGIHNSSDIIKSAEDMFHLRKHVTSVYLYLHIDAHAHTQTAKNVAHIHAFHRATFLLKRHTNSSSVFFGTFFSLLQTT